jgi:Derlin-2/3
MADDPMRWFLDIPVVSRVYLSAALATSAACFMDVVSPLTLYFNLDLIWSKGQYWRLFSSFFYFGTFGLDFIFHMYFVVRASWFLISLFKLIFSTVEVEILQAT